MINLTSYKILLYHYPYTTSKLEELIWKKMDEVESKFAVRLTLDGVNESGEYNHSSWDLFFLEPKLKEKIDLMLDKYKIDYMITDYTNFLGEKREEFTEDFISKLINFLNKNLTIDDVLDRIIEVGYDGLTSYEKFYLSNNIEIRKKMIRKLILLLTLIVIITSCSYDSKYKYVIYNNKGVLYYANFYEENEDGCIMFNDRPGLDNTPGKPTLICGDYTIEKIK